MPKNPITSKLLTSPDVKPKAAYAAAERLADAAMRTGAGAAELKTVLECLGVLDLSKDHRGGRNE